MLTDENDPELEEIRKLKTKSDVVLYMMSSEKWLSPTGGLIMPLEDIKSPFEDIHSFVITTGGAYILVEDNTYFLKPKPVFMPHPGQFGQCKVYKFPFKLTHSDRKIVNSLLLQFDELYARSNIFLFNSYRLPYGTASTEYDRIFNVIYNKVVEARMLEGRGRSPGRAGRSRSPGRAERSRSPRRAGRSRSPRRAENILAQMNKETNKTIIKKLQNEYTHAVHRGLIGGKKLKGKYTKKHNQKWQN
jgi:hypothetical protein